MRKSTTITSEQVAALHEKVLALEAELSSLPTSLDDAVTADDEAAYAVLKNRVPFVMTRLHRAKGEWLAAELVHLESQEEALRAREAEASKELASYQTAVEVYQAAVVRAARIHSMALSSVLTLSRYITEQHHEISIFESTPLRTS